MADDKAPNPTDEAMAGQDVNTGNGEAASIDAAQQQILGFAAQPLSYEEYLSNLSRIANADVDALKDFYYLLLRWAVLIIYIIDPVLPHKDEPEVIEVRNGLRIANYGDYLAVSRGQEWAEGTRCTGKLIESTKAIIQKLKDLANTTGKRVDIALAGHEIARRAAWIEVSKPNIQEKIRIVNFTPDINDLIAREIVETHAAHDVQEILNPEPKP